ncbi:16S rRNA (guanine(527)-N(7))-methyltransferase RsmG, partial [uncultured Parasutterella sp.]
TLIPLLKEFEQPNGKTSVMDVGCGGGLPGIPAAILLPNFRFTLVDTVAKKIAFVSQVIINLKLLNAQAVNARVESYCPEEKFDLITSRAFASISTFINLTEKHLSKNGRWIVMKGKLPEEEIEKIPDFVKVVEIRKVEIPNVDSERHLVVLSRK